jgi:putative hydrolase of the HAD superfamily
LYDYAKVQFEELMKNQGFPSGNIIETFDRLDAKRVEIAKFSKSRFYESMLIIYAMLCGTHNKNWDIRAEMKIRDLGSSVFTTPRLYDDTISTLKIMTKSFQLALFTGGDREVQRRKIDSLGNSFKSYFSKIHISDKKDEPELRKIIDDLAVPTKKIWVIGNSVKSDINPALKLGLSAILVHRKTWIYEEEELLSNDVIVVHSLTEAARAILERVQSGEK